MEVQEHVRRFNDRCAIRGDPQSAWQMVAGLIQQRGWKKPLFCKMTLLDDYVYDRAMSNHKLQPGTHILMSVCAGMDLDLESTEDVLSYIGVRLGETKRGRAYKHIIRDMAGYSIHDRNEFLKMLGLKPLGSNSKKK